MDTKEITKNNVAELSNDDSANVVSESYKSASLETRIMVDKILSVVKGLTISDAKRTIRIASHCVNVTIEKMESANFF